MKMKAHYLAAAVLAGVVPGSRTPGAESPPAEVVRVGASAEAVPGWAAKELEAFAAIETCYREFLKRFVREDGSTVVTADCHHGNIDDILEGFFKWDKFILLAASDELREKYVKVWKYHWKYGNKKGFFRDGFYLRGYDAEHAGELLPLLWACLELAPDDKELVATNKAVAEVLTSERWFHPANHLFKFSCIYSRRADRQWQERRLKLWRGECAVNTIYSSGVWLAYLTTGQENYRQWVLDYCRAWNKAAAMNKGVFPYHIDTESMKLGPGGDGRWWKGTELAGKRGTASFDFERKGLVTSTRGWRNLPVAAAFLDGGDPRCAAGLVSTVKALFANALKGLPAAAYSPEQGGWFREGKWPHHIPVLLDKAYVLTWEGELAKLMADYPVDKVGSLEREVAVWCNFTYNRKGELKVAERAFERAGRRARERMSRAAAETNPEDGDDLTSVTLGRLGDLDYVDGAQWAGHNARCGGPSPGPVGYFDESGRRGLPEGVAALVRHTDEGSATVLLCNTGKEPARVLITGGYYGQHRIDGLQAGGVRRRINARRVAVELPAGGAAEVMLGLTRCAYEPTLWPQSR